MNWDDAISSVAKTIYYETGIPVEKESFFMEQTPRGWRVDYLGKEIALLDSIDDESCLEDSILSAMDKIKKLSIDARMAIMRKRLDQLSGAVLEELRLKGIDSEILGDIFFEVEDMGYPLMHYETEKEERGYPDIALTASWDVVKVSHVLDYDMDTPHGCFSYGIRISSELQQYL